MASTYGHLSRMLPYQRTLLLVAALMYCMVLQPADAESVRLTAHPQLFDGKPRTGSFLVAGKDMQDPRFRHAVILLVQYGDNGAIGLVINRPTTLNLSGFSAKFLREGDADVLYFGGPVQPMAFSMLVGADHGAEYRSPVMDKVYHVFGVRQIMAEIKGLNPANTVRIYAGYAGWAPEQLEFEIAHGSWHVMPGEPGRVFSADPQRMWTDLIRQAGGHWI